MITALLDGNIYDRLDLDEECRAWIADLIAAGRLRIIVTPVVIDELKKSPFGGVPNWFPVVVGPEAVVVLGYARLGIARMGNGAVYKEHRGASNKIPDAEDTAATRELSGAAQPPSYPSADAASVTTSAPASPKKIDAS